MIFTLLFNCLVYSLVGCSGSLQAIWKGTCTFEDNISTEDLLVTADVRRDNGYLLEGEMILVDWDQEEYRSSLSGDHSGKYVSLRSDIDTALGLYRFQVDAVRVGSTLDGDCQIKSPSSPGGLIGEILLER